LSFTLPASPSTVAAATSTDVAIASSIQIASTATIEVLAVDTSSLPVPAATFGVLGADVPATTSAGAMTADFTAMINQTAPSATSSAGLPVGVVAFTGAARKMDLGVGIGGLLGVVAVAGWVL
jgi:hypothetical protein